MICRRIRVGSYTDLDENRLELDGFGVRVVVHFGYGTGRSIQIETTVRCVASRWDRCARCVDDGAGFAPASGGDERVGARGARDGVR